MRDRKGLISAFSLIVLMVLNLCYMHYEVYVCDNGVTNPAGRWAPLYFILFDILIPVFFFEVITLGRRKIAYSLTYALVLFFTIANIVYSRFLGQYIPIDGFLEYENMQGSWWLGYVFEAFRWTDIFIIANIIISIFVIRRLPNEKSWKAPVRVLCLILAIAVFYAFRVSVHYEDVTQNNGDNTPKTEWILRQFIGNADEPVYAPNAHIFAHGIVVGQLFSGIINRNATITLSEKEKSEIFSLIKSRNKGTDTLSDSCKIQGKPNVVMIILESGLSRAIDERVNGKYVMPHLRALAYDTHNYYNPQIISNRGAGESSDAQVSYFTGLIPLKNEFTIMRVLKDSVIALPELLAGKGYTTCITIPNDENFWHQKELNHKYGFTHSFALGTKDNGNWCQDDEIFCNVIEEQKNLHAPFFHVVLTLSMHSPYVEGADSKYQNYLVKCHFADTQIGQYISHLKKSGTYDNTVIMIVSDHEPPSDCLDVSEKASEYSLLPLIIVNSGIAPSRFSKKPCNQIDLFPTMLDMFGIQSEWRGVGRSLLRDYDTYLLTEKEERISANILRSNLWQTSER